MTQHLFLFTIGPVQSFISQARKTQDLYASSFLLSRLIGSTMKKLKGQVSYYEPIFPSEDFEKPLKTAEFAPEVYKEQGVSGGKSKSSSKDIKSKPNRFIAKIESDDVEKVGKELKSFVENQFRGISTRILEELEELKLDSPAGFESQIKDFLQVNWVALPLEKDSYETTYEKIESYLGSIKNVRDFGQLKETGRKCSLCGERNVLFYRLTDNEKKNGGLKTRRDGLLKKLYVKEADVIFYEPEERDNLKMQKGEGLCAVCFTKRFLDKYFENGDVKNYPSTAEIALMDSLTKLNSLNSGLLQGYREIFAENFDAELYYEDNLTKKYFEKNNYPAEKLEEVKIDLKKISDNARENDVIFSKYYAILMLDGDNMGRWLSGEFLEEPEKARLEEFHKKLTKQLGSFAEHVKDSINEPKGKLVYAGGDDVLAFINLNHLLPVMEKLRKGFPEFENLKNDKKSSASCGVAIAHYKTPLSEALNWARKMEKKEAKEKGGRDSFAIAVLKRSGGISKTMFKWQYISEQDDTTSSIEILEYLIKSLKPQEASKQADFSNKFIKNMGVEFTRLMDEGGKYNDESIVKTEMKRLIKRSCMMTGKQDETRDDFKDRKKKAINDLTEKLGILYTNSKSLDNFMSSLNIADFIKRGGS